MARRRVRKVYRASLGARFSNEDAEAIGEELEKLGPSLTPELVVEVAREPDSALHPHFEWDNKAAADLYREDQARYILRHVNVVISTPDGGEHEVRAFHHVQITIGGNENQDVYAPLDIVLASAELRTQVLERAKRELESWRRRYREYSDVFATVFSAIDEVRIPAEAAAQEANV
jgi:hypothetical protein